MVLQDNELRLWSQKAKERVGLGPLSFTDLYRSVIDRDLLMGSRKVKDVQVQVDLNAIHHEEFRRSDSLFLLLWQTSSRRNIVLTTASALLLHAPI